MVERHCILGVRHLQTAELADYISCYLYKYILYIPIPIPIPIRSASLANRSSSLANPKRESASLQSAFIAHRCILPQMRFFFVEKRQKLSRFDISSRLDIAGQFSTTLQKCTKSLYKIEPHNLVNECQAHCHSRTQITKNRDLWPGPTTFRF